MRAGGTADTFIVNGRVATMNRRRPFASTLAIEGGTIIGVGSEADLDHLRGQGTAVIDAGGRTVVPGLNDAHTHFIRGGLTYSMEVRWDGLPSLADGLRMMREQARRILGVLERVNREVPLAGLRWGLDHCETIQPSTLERVAALGGSINIQNRMSADGEAFLSKYGPQVSADAPPIGRIREMGIPMAAGTDANRANSYNPWVGVHWLVTGKTMGGAKLNADRNLLDRTEALRMYTAASAWISGEEDKKGTLEVGRFADLAFLSADYFKIPEDSIKDLESVLTMVGGKVVYGAGVYERLAPPPPPIKQDWLPIKTYGGYQKHAGTAPAAAALGGGHAHPLIIGDCGAWSMDCPCGAF